MLLEMKNVQVHYHKVAALKGINITIPDQGIVTIIGANGAGKSTTLRAISGLVRTSQGEIHFAGQRIDRLAPEKIVALGIAHVPEGRRVFPDLTVEENLRTGAFLRSDKAVVYWLRSGCMSKWLRCQRQTLRLTRGVLQTRRSSAAARRATLQELRRRSQQAQLLVQVQRE